MSYISYLLKKPEEMRTEHTKPVRVGRYFLSSHAQNRIVDSSRKIKKLDLIREIHSKAIATSPIRKKIITTYEYDRIGRCLTLRINPDTNCIVSAWRTNDKIAARYGYIKKGRYYYKIRR